MLGLVFARAPWHIYAVFLALSTFSSFFTPARSVAIPQIVPLNGLMSANALIQQTVQILQMASPVLAGALAGWAGPSSCYYLDSASFVFSGLMIATIVIPARPAHANREVKPVVRDLLSGVRFIFGHPVIGFVILSIAAGTFAISAFGSLIAVYVRDVLHANSVPLRRAGIGHRRRHAGGRVRGDAAGPPHRAEGAPDHRGNPVVRSLDRCHRLDSEQRGGAGRAAFASALARRC